MDYTSESSTFNQVNDPSGNAKVSRISKGMKITALTFFTLFCLVFFTLIKMPDDRLKAYINGTISAELAPRGITFNAGESHLSYWFGTTYTLKDVTLTLPPPTPPAHIDKVEISPSLFGLLLGRTGAQVRIWNGNGKLSSFVSIKKTSMSLSLDAQKLDLGKLGVLPIAAGIPGSAVLDGKGKLDGDTAIPSSLEGNFQLQLSKVTIDPQTLYGFSLPRINLSEGTIDVELAKAKAVIKTLKLGKTGNPNDDIQGTVTGDVNLGQTWAASNLNLQARFSLSENIKKSLILLDALLGAGKQSDGSYSYKLTGSALAPNPVPVPAGGR
jgi:type II secretion system protein N